MCQQQSLQQECGAITAYQHVIGFSTQLNADLHACLCSLLKKIAILDVNI